MSIFILKPVGSGGVNDKEDTSKIQHLLNRAKFRPQLIVDGICGRLTCTAIHTFQGGFMLTPDGRVDPGGRTLRELNELSPTAGSPRETPASSKVRTNTTTDWDGDSARWSQNKKLASLHPDFKEKIQAVLKELEARSFQPKIFYGWRSVEVQQELYRKKRSKVTFSFHNAQKTDGTPLSYAVDIIDKRWAWGAAAEANGFWKALGEASKSQDLFWGGDWQSFKDWAHVQFLPNHALKRIKRESGLA